MRCARGTYGACSRSRKAPWRSGACRVRSARRADGRSDANLAELQRRYAEDGLRVPDRVFNSLRRKREAA